MGNCVGNLVDDQRRRTTATTKPIIDDSDRKFSPPNKDHSDQNASRANGKEPIKGTGDYHQHGVSGESSPPQPAGKIVTPNLRIFTLDELKSTTRNFRPDTMVGEGGFGIVFKGWVEENSFKPSKVSFGIPIAVKKSKPDSLQGMQEWLSEVKFLGKFSHPNLVKLHGYCWEENQFLLVYEYMLKGSLENHLFRKGPEPLPWEIRLKIAIGAARGLAFLHTSEKSVIYRDFKSSNILLDGAYNAKLSDFGLAKFGPVNGKSHVTTRVMGTYGYAAPEYMATGHLYVKSDVYGFGVVLLEILTGSAALDPNRPSGKHSLVDCTTPFLNEKKKLKRVMDPRLGNQYPITAAFQIAQLILKCLESDPKNRPSMEVVLATLEKANEIMYRPKSRKVCAVHQSTRRAEENYTFNQHRSPIHRQRGGSGYKPHF